VWRGNRPVLTCHIYRCVGTVESSGERSINSPQYAIKVISSHHACVDVGTPRFRLQHSRADKQFGSEYAAAISTTFWYRASRKRSNS